MSMRGLFPDIVFATEWLYNEAEIVGNYNCDINNDHRLIEESLFRSTRLTGPLTLRHHTGGSAWGVSFSLVKLTRHINPTKKKEENIAQKIHQ